jgi:carbonic anhydrase/acetyltransferase-like protein (isoleucine patch superfamily)
MALIKSVRGFTPEFGEGCFLADNATIIGDVVMGDNCSVWFNAVVRGDVHFIRIGNGVNIQDGAVIHGTYETAPTSIGNNVSVAHNAIVHGCTIHDNVLIGMNAVVMDNAVIGESSIIAAGAIILENTIVEPGSVYAGIPAKKISNISKAQTSQLLNRISKNYIKYAGWYQDEDFIAR